MYRLRVEDYFDAAHFLRGYKGKCSNLHGHTWKVEVFIIGRELDKTGMVIDFGILKKALKKVLDEFDHKCINEHSNFDGKVHDVNPTAENLSVYIKNCLFNKLCNISTYKTGRACVEKVRVWESPKAYCEYD